MTTVELARELQQRVTAFNAGDEKYAGEWLANFQRMDGAWMVCVDALCAGNPNCCDAELLQEFCAQTLARLSRSFLTHHPQESRQAARDTLEGLLGMHANNPACVWKQLALGLTCADLWLGTWNAASALQSISLPLKVRRELLVLPPELLFNERALPLSEQRLRQAVASALQAASEPVFAFLLESTVETPSPSEGAQSLLVLSAWLRAIRKSLRWLPGSDEVAPLRHLAVHGDALAAAISVAPKEACEVAQQLARWNSCDIELAALLQPFLTCIFAAEFTGCELLPLLTDLASNCWPRAALGDFEIDWQAIAMQALLLLRRSLEADDDDGGDAEAILAVWQTFATTVRDGVSEPTGPQTGDGPMETKEEYEPPEKRTKTRQQWRVPPERIAESASLPQLYKLLITHLVELQGVRGSTDTEALIQTWNLRVVAVSVLGAWAELVGESVEWQETMWAPFRRVRALLAQSRADGGNEDVWHEAEVTLWLASSIASVWPRIAGTVPITSLVQEFDATDNAPNPWRALLWSSACTLGALALAEHRPQLIDWMLRRSPLAAGAPELLELTELPYAQALEHACQHLPSNVTHTEVGDRLFGLAFTQWPPSASHDDSLEAQAAILRAMRHAMGSDTVLLWQSVAGKVLPLLCQAVTAEAEKAPTEADPSWYATQSLFSTLTALVPSGTVITDEAHPAVAAFKELWRFFEAALVQWPQSASTDQPAKSAAAALQEAVACLPTLLPEALSLLVRSSTIHDQPDVQLRALRGIAVAVPCPPIETTRAAELLAPAIANSVEGLLARPTVLVQSPQTLIAVFGLLAEALRPSPAGMTGLGLCEDRLRPALLSQPGFAEFCLSFICEGLPECPSAEAARDILLVSSRLLRGDEIKNTDFRSIVNSALPAMCTSVCQALATQKYLTDLDADHEALADATDVFLCAAEAFPAEVTSALDSALVYAKCPESCSDKFKQALASKAQWPQGPEWIEHVHQIVLEWQREISRVLVV